MELGRRFKQTECITMETFGFFKGIVKKNKAIQHFTSAMTRKGKVGLRYSAAK